jgi:hypothetical protein
MYVALTHLPRGVLHSEGTGYFWGVLVSGVYAQSGELYLLGHSYHFHDNRISDALAWRWFKFRRAID